MTRLLGAPLLSRSWIVLFLALAGVGIADGGELRTWDGKHPIDRIEVTVVYFVPQDRAPLPDWRERVDYYCKRIEQFHAREFEGQSTLKTVIRPTPFISSRATRQLRQRDADFIFFRTLEEVDAALEFGKAPHESYPILLVLSDINWRPLDDFYRLKPTENGKFEFEGSYSEGRHSPGAPSGGARATYLAERGVGWGIVSGDGWRVPYSGTDCVVYHEGVGHTVGLPHPQPGDGSVMSFGQYRGWLSQSWLDDAQKKRLGWTAPEKPQDRKNDLFSTFTAVPEPLIPKPGEPASLRLTWPEGARVKSCRVRIQTDLYGPWVDVASPANEPKEPGSAADASQGVAAPSTLPLAVFDRPTPVSYRVEAKLIDGREAEIWGYFQVREKPDVFPLPVAGSREAVAQDTTAQIQVQPKPLEAAVDLLALVDTKQDAVAGTWEKVDGVLTSPKQYGARIELPYRAPEEYELVAIVEPLDEPNGFLLGQRLGGQRFAVLVNYAQKDKPPVSALENIDGKNVGNLSTERRPVFMKNRPAEIVCRVKKGSVSVACDGEPLLDWQGDAKQLSLSDYWKTPHDDTLFLGAYDCRYRVTRVTLTPITGAGQPTR